MRLIDADWLLSYLNLTDMDFPESTEKVEKIDIEIAIGNAPTFEVVQCKDCWYYSPLSFKPSIGDCHYWLREERIDSLPVYEDDFCSYGSRR